MNTYFGKLHFHSETGTEGGYWAFQDARWITLNGHGEERWSYYGLHILQDGDELTIYEPSTEQVAWLGTIDLVPCQLFTEDAFNMWIHADQRDLLLNREQWATFFMKEYPAELRTDCVIKEPK